MDEPLTPNRRAILAGAVGTAFTVASPLVADTTGINPDAELLAAWGAFVAAYRALDAAPDELTDEEREARYWAPIDAAEQKIMTLPAHTHAGYAVKFRLLFKRFDGSIDAENYALFDEGPLPDSLSGTVPDGSLSMLWTMVKHAERVGGVA